MPVCIDVTEAYVAEDPKFSGCFGNVTWAKQTGYATNPEFYTNYTAVGLTEKSSFADWQCVLSNKVGVGGGHGWNCPHPCSASLPGYCAIVAVPTLAPTPNPTSAPTAAPIIDKDVTIKVNATTAAPNITLTTTAAAGSSGSSSIEWYWIALIALALCGVAAAAYFFMCMGKKKGASKKKKRAVAPPKVSAPLPAAPAVPTPQVTTSQPVYMTTAAPIYQQPAPVITTAYRAAAPAYQYAAAPAAGSSFVMASPVPAMSTPIPTYGVQQVATGANFDLLDRNHDGVISRDEFNAMRR